MGKLKDYCINITDGEHGSVKDDPNGKFYYLNNNNITENGIRIRKDDRRISKEDYERIHKRTKLSIGDIVIISGGTNPFCYQGKDIQVCLHLALTSSSSSSSVAFRHLS